MQIQITHASRDIALELYEVLRAIDPARFQAELVDDLRRRLAEVERRIAALVDATTQDQAPTVRERLATLRLVLAEHTPTAAAVTREAWMELRVRLVPAYEGLAAGLRAQAMDVPALRPTNYSRNILHVCGALVALLLITQLLTPFTMLAAASAMAAFAWSLELGRWLVPGVNELCMRVLGRFAHPHERHRVNSSTWYSTALLGLALSGSVDLAAIGVVVLGFADPAAAVIGRRYGRIGLVNGRSLEGSTAFVAVGTVAAFVVICLSQPTFSLVMALLVAFGGALPAALAELFSRNVDDNLTIPLAAAAGSGLVALMLGMPLI